MRKLGGRLKGTERKEMTHDENEREIKHIPPRPKIQ